VTSPDVPVKYVRTVESVTVARAEIASARDPDAEEESVRNVETVERAVIAGAAKSLLIRVIRVDPNVPAWLVTVVEVVITPTATTKPAGAHQVPVDVILRVVQIVNAPIQGVTVTIQHALVVHRSPVQPSEYHIIEMEPRVDL